MKIKNELVIDCRGNKISELEKKECNLIGKDLICGKISNC